MGQGWANEEETTFLQGYMPKYELCQVKRNYQTFWPGLFAAYQAKFPLIEKLWPNQSKTLEALTDEENESYKKKLKAKHEVRLPFASEIDVVRLTSPESLKEWFRWRANPRSRNTANAVTKKDLKNIYQPNRTRGHKSYEIFAKLFRDTVDPIVEEACRVQGITGRGKLPVWHKVASGLWRNASQEQIDAVNAQIEAARDKGNDEETDGEPTPETYHQ